MLLHVQYSGTQTEYCVLSLYRAISPFFKGSNCLTGPTKPHFLIKSIGGIHLRNRNNTMGLDIHLSHSNNYYSLKSPQGSHRSINILTTKGLIKCIYLICERYLASRIKSDRIQLTSCSFPNFISHLKDKKLFKIFDQPRGKSQMKSRESLGTAEEML